MNFAPLPWHLHLNEEPIRTRKRGVRRSLIGSRESPLSPAYIKRPLSGPTDSPQSGDRSPLGSEPFAQSRKMSLFVSRPEDLNSSFWDMLLLLAWEPDFEFLWQALSLQPDEAASVDSPPGAAASVVETSEGGSGAAAPPGGARMDEDSPQADEAAAAANPAGKPPNGARFSSGMRRKRRVLKGRRRFPSLSLSRVFFFLPSLPSSEHAC